MEDVQQEIGITVQNGFHMEISTNVQDCDAINTLYICLSCDKKPMYRLKDVHCYFPLKSNNVLNLL